MPIVSDPSKTRQGGQVILLVVVAIIAVAWVRQLYLVTIIIVGVRAF